MILCSFTIQSPNAAATELNVLLGNSLLGSPFQKLAMAAFIVVFFFYDGLISLLS